MGCRADLRARGEDGDSGAGGGEGVVAAGAGDDAGGDLCAVQGVCGGDCPKGDDGGGADDSLGRSDCDEHGQRLCTARRSEAMREVFSKETVFVRGGGSIPIVGDFVRELGIPTVMMGFGSAGR